MSIAILAGGARSGPLLGRNNPASPHLPVPANVVITPSAPIFRIRQTPASAMKSSPDRLKPMALGFTNQASGSGVPSEAGFGLMPARVLSVDSGVTWRILYPGHEESISANTTLPRASKARL